LFVRAYEVQGEINTKRGLVGLSFKQNTKGGYFFYGLLLSSLGKKIDSLKKSLSFVKWRRFCTVTVKKIPGIVPKEVVKDAPTVRAVIVNV